MNKTNDTLCSKADHDVSISLMKFLKSQWSHITPDIESISKGSVHICLF